MPAPTPKYFVSIYVVVVMLVFFGLMTALFNRETGVQDDRDLDIADKEIVAIIEQYRDTRISSVEVSLEDIGRAVPAPAKPAWIANSVSSSNSVVTAGNVTAAPRIVIIIDDLGLDEEATIRLGQAVGPYTLAFLPYAQNLARQTSAVSAAGHELMVHLPMQSHRKSADPGENALLADLSYEEFSSRIDWNLSRFTGYVGVNNHMGSRLTEDPTLMVRLMSRLRQDGLLFVDSLTTPNSMGRRAAKALDVPFIARDVFLDNEQDARYIARQLETTEKIARLRGYAIAIGHPYEETLTALEAWEKTLEFKGLQLVPVSQVMAEITGVSNPELSR